MLFSGMVNVETMEHTFEEFQIEDAMGIVCQELGGEKCKAGLLDKE